MSVATRLRNYLDREGVRYDVVAHPRTSAASRSAQAAHVPGQQLAKSVVVHHELGYVICVLPSTHRIELGTLQSVLNKRLGLATETEVASLFDDCDIGAVPPIGAAYGVPVVVDESLGEAKELYFEGGDHATLVHVGGEAFRTLTRDAQRARFSHRA